MSKKKHGHHGGAWKVAYADFTTAMMALFLCLWLTSQDHKIKEAIERAFRNPFSAVTKESMGLIPNPDITSTHRPSGQFNSVSAVEMETMRRITDDLSRILQDQEEGDQSIKVDFTGDGLRINVFDRMKKPIFEPGTEHFTPYGAWVFSTLAWEISRYTSFKIELEGHTETGVDAKPDALAKWDLSTERANATLRKLTQSGVATTQFAKVSGYGDTQPMDNSLATDEVNRRVTIMLRMKETMAAIAAQTATAQAQASPNDSHPN